MAIPAPARTGGPDSRRLRDVVREQGYFFRQAAILSLLIGGYLHVTRAFIGDQLLLEHVLTPTFDQVLTVPMVYTAVAGVLGWKLIDFRARWQRIVYVVILVYFVGSLPLHLRSFVDENAVEALTRFPMWWTYCLFVLFPAMMAFCAGLRYHRR